MNYNAIEIKKIYFEITDVWKVLCEKHSILLDKTFDEYSCLLQSDIDKLEKTVAEKQLVVDEVVEIEKRRALLIENLQVALGTNEVNHFDSLIKIFNEKIDEEKDKKHLFRFNRLLIDIIEKIQAQNKKNQLFLNKALMSIKDIREQFSGRGQYQTYTNKGSKVANTRL